MWNKNERDGKVDQAKGKIKQVIGTVTGDDNVKTEGQVDEAVGHVESVIGRASRKAGDVVAKFGRSVKGEKP